MTSHPWLTFSVDMRRFDSATWLLLGEASSKCQHVSGAPLKPQVAAELNRIFLTKGVHGTTSIEGNTLTEEEVRAIVDGESDLPRSREYLEQEVQNIVDACNDVVGRLVSVGPQPLTPETICGYNAAVLRDLAVDEGVVPGEIRTNSVGVRRYLGAPARDCEYLLGQLCDWLNGPDFDASDGDAFAFTRAISKAILAHLYIAWIHPFGDGNGRTARLIEFQLLLEAGIPLPAAHLLSDHYNRTRENYYRVLDGVSKPPYPVEEFFHYGLQGFVDELRGQLGTIRTYHLTVTWENYVHEQFRDQETPARRRQKRLVLCLPADEWVSRSELTKIDPELAVLYAGRQAKTVTRDLNVLSKMGLIRRSGRGVCANRDIVLAFLPLRADGPVATSY